MVAPVAVGVVLLGAAWFALARPSRPGGTFVAVGAASAFAEGQARAVSIPGVYVGRMGGRLFALRADTGCTLTLCGTRYLDCRGAAYGLDGEAEIGTGGLDLLPVTTHDGTVYVDPGRPVERSPGPPPTKPATCPVG